MTTGIDVLIVATGTVHGFCRRTSVIHTNLGHRVGEALLPQPGSDWLRT